MVEEGQGLGAGGAHAAAVEAAEGLDEERGGHGAQRTWTGGMEGEGDGSSQRVNRRRTVIVDLSVNLSMHWTYRFIQPMPRLDRSNCKSCILIGLLQHARARFWQTLLPYKIFQK